MRYMKTMLFVIFNINAAMNANRFIFYSKRLPLLGKRIPDKLYRDGDLKMIVSVVAAIWNIIRKLIGKAIYLGLMFLVPLFLIFKEIPRVDYPQAFVQMFFFLSFLAGTIQISVLLDSSQIKFICIKMMRFPARDYVVPTFLATHIANLIYFLPALIVSYVILGGEILQTLILVGLMTALRFICEACQLQLFHKRGILYNKKYLLQWAVIIPSCVAAYLPLYRNIIWPIDRMLFNLPVILLLLTGAAVSLVYILRFPEYKRTLQTSLKLDDFMVDLKEVKGEVLFQNVKMKEDEFSKESLQSVKFDKKQGYEYLNAIFFERHRKLMVKPIIIRLCVIGVALIAGIAVFLIFPELVNVMNHKLLSIMPLFVFIMYSICLGDQVCKAMFYNCDISLLRYSFYRHKDVILRSFMVRLRKIMMMNLVLGIALCAALCLFVLIAGVLYQPLDLLLFTVSILCLCVFFSVHHLFLYYVFQPYTTELDMKNPFFRTINTIVYLACFGCLQLGNVPGFFTTIVICATVTYIAVALVLVYRLAPENFRVK